MFNLPYISLPEHFTKLLVTNIQNSAQTNNSLEQYLNDHKELNSLVKRVFKDIDSDGFLGKIISISGWTGIRNRLASVYLEYAMTGQFPESANINLVTDIINIENKLRHFTHTGFSRSFLLGFYAKMTLIQLKKVEDNQDFSALILKDEHFEFMKWSKAKSVRIDWLFLELVQLEHFLGAERMNTMLKSGTRHDALFAFLSAFEQKQIIQNFMTYGASIYDKEMFLTDLSSQA